MKALILLLLISLSGCAQLMRNYDANMAAEERNSRPWVKPPSHFDKYGYEVWDTGEYLNDWEKKKAEAQDLAKMPKPEIKENPKYTACIHYGNAYVQAINIRNQWSFSDQKSTYNAILGHVKAVLSNYPQFSPEGIVDNVLHNPALRPPVGGNPFMLQIVQLCMDETKRLAIKP